MYEFIFLFLFRSISGLQNGLGYAHDKSRAVVSIIMVVSLLGAIVFATETHQAPIPVWVVYLFIGASMIGVHGVETYFHPNDSFLGRHLHLWELVATTGITLAVVAMGGNLITIACAVYPAMILHKGFINKGNDLPWWDERTDDPTGDTYGIPVLGIKVPRLSTQYRVVLAVVSVVIAVLTVVKGWHFSIYNVWPWL